MVLTKQILTEINPEKMGVEAKLISILKQEKTKTVSIKDTVNVFFIGRVGVENDKHRQFRDDIYELDKMLFQN